MSVLDQGQPLRHGRQHGPQTIDEGNLGSRPCAGGHSRPQLTYTLVAYEYSTAPLIN
jgi:hypothetical protein